MFERTRLPVIPSVASINCTQELETVATQMQQDNTAHILELRKVLEGIITPYQEKASEELGAPEEEVPLEQSGPDTSTRLDVHLKVRASPPEIYVKP